MSVSVLRRAALPAALVALAIAALLAPAAPAAQPAPSLASTAQYKSFTKYVAKLRGMRGAPATAERKSTLESNLTDRHGAVVARSAALFQSAKRAAKAKVQARFAASSRKVRMAESQELSQIRAMTAARLDRSLRSFDRGIGAVEDYYDAAEARLKKELRTARKQRAKAKGPLAVAQFDIRIEELEKQIVDNRNDEVKARKRFRTRYTKQKQAIQATKAEEASKVQEGDQAVVNSLRAHRDRSYRLQVSTLQVRREAQLASLEDKLDAGRMAIAEMPTAAA